MMTGSSFGACLRISASSAAMSDRRLSSTAAMYSAGVFTFSCPFIFIASSETRRHLAGSGPSALPSMNCRTTGSALSTNARGGTAVDRRLIAPELALGARQIGQASAFAMAGQR